MRLVYPPFGLELNLDEENVIYAVTIESEHNFADFVSNLWGQSQGREGRMILSEGASEKQIAKEVDVIVNPFELDCNDRKILTKLYSELGEIAAIDLQDETARLNSAILNYLDMLLERVPYHLNSALDVDMTAFLKTYEVKLEESSDCLAERVVEYLRVMHRIGGIKIFVFVNLKQFLTQEELEGVYEFACYEKIRLILAEQSYRKPLEREKMWIFDRDSCIIETNQHHFADGYGSARIEI